MKMQSQRCKYHIRGPDLRISSSLFSFPTLTYEPVLYAIISGFTNPLYARLCSWMDFIFLCCDLSENLCLLAEVTTVTFNWMFHISLDFLSHQHPCRSRQYQGRSTSLDLSSRICLLTYSTPLKHHLSPTLLTTTIVDTWTIRHTLQPCNIRNHDRPSYCWDRAHWFSPGRHE